MSSHELVEIKILKQYYEEIQKIIKTNSQFSTVSDYVNYVLKEILHKENDEGYSKEEEELIKKRLEDLGYL